MEIEDKLIQGLLGDGYTACVINRIVLELTNDLTASALMGQIIYLTKAFRPVRKISAIAHPAYYAKTKGWAFYKESDEFMEDLKIGRKPFDRAMKLLKNLGFIETKRFTIGNGNAVLHYRIMPKFVADLILKSSEVEERKKGRKKAVNVNQGDNACNVQIEQPIYNAPTSDIDNEIPF